ncbi:MAG: GNAT family N-acetyltransferase, partial [Gammaproteobacteria bacterium]|nr:GNAT family N-acetyltransferase [Gammaproteobacteria bacterium]
LWQQIHNLYSRVFNVKSGVPTLSQAFFETIGRTMSANIVVVLAMHHNKVIACAINLRSADTLYGRHWGTSDYHDCLHFETCYYAGIDYCISNGLKRFEPGAQGAHKIARGFLPVATGSAHWLAHPGFMKSAIKFCSLEQEAVAEYIRDSWSRHPYRSDAVPIPEPKQAVGGGEQDLNDD